MTTGILNYPRKLLSEREKTIRATLARITSTSTTAVGSIAAAHTTADQSFSVSSLADVTDLKLAVSNGVYYTFKFVCVVQSAVLTCAVKLGLDVPAFSTYAATVQSLYAADGAAALWSGALTFSGDSVVATDVPVINTDYIVTIEGIILPSADGFLQVRAANEDNASTVKTRKGCAGYAVAV